MVIHNTVVKNPLAAFSPVPWLGTSPHKNGTPSSGNIVRNNLVSRFKGTPAVKWVAGQRAQNDLGRPTHQKTMMVEGVWGPGKTVNPPC